MDEMLDPGVVGIAHGRHPIDPALVILQQLASPVAVIERRVGEHKVGLEVRVAVVVKGVTLSYLGIDAADGEVHLGQAPGGVIRFLAVNGDVPEPAGVHLDEPLTLHKHAPRAAAGIVDPSFVRREHLYQDAHDVSRRVELATLLALGARELGEEVFIHAAERIFRTFGRIAQCDVAHEVNELTQPLFIETGAGVVLGQHALERRVIPFDRCHRVDHERADNGLGSTGLSDLTNAPLSAPRRCLQHGTHRGLRDRLLPLAAPRVRRASLRRRRRCT